MKSISILIKPASSLCNLRCSYCFYHDVAENRNVAQYGIMDDKTTEQLIKKAFEAVKENGSVSFSFQGGEPTVAGLAYFENFIQTVNKYKENRQVNFSLQTNATLIDDNWAKFFHEQHFLIGVSLDGYQTNMDKFRYDASKQSVYFRVKKTLQLFKKYDVQYNILTVVTESLAKSPKALYNFYKENHFEYVQLIPCLPFLNGDQSEALTPKTYASFFKQIFDLWYEDLLKGQKMSINLFDNLIGMFQTRVPYQCGMIGSCFMQHVIEADGSVYPCDFYVLDSLKTGNINTDTFEMTHQTSTAQEFIKEKATMLKPCLSCQFKNICNGGCKRQNICYLSEEYCGYKEFLEYTFNRFKQII